MIIKPFLGKHNRKPPKLATRRELLSAGEKAKLSNRKRRVKITLAETTKGTE